MMTPARFKAEEKAPDPVSKPASKIGDRQPPGPLNNPPLERTAAAL